MNVYTYLNLSAPELDLQLIPLWADSWEAQGWTPRLLTIRDTKRSPRFCNEADPAWLAWEHVGGGWYCPVHVLNFSFRPKKLREHLEFFAAGVLWASKSGANELIHRARSVRRLGKNLVGRFGIDPIMPLISFSDCESVDAVQRGIELCSQDQKKI